MTVFLEYLRKKLGWCPNVDAIRPARQTAAEAGYENAWKGRGPGAAPTPEPAGTAGGDLSGYQENMLLILLALAWLVAYRREFLPILVVLSAVAMFYDAQSIHAGDNFEKETLLGDIVTWQPLTWGAATLVGGVIIMVIYLFHRREIYRANSSAKGSVLKGAG
ncbi:DUF1673 domain-containing protein [Methanoculleus sp. 7T]|jgi:hypothetical protein|uniref:DUF1673 domain-containing protein n=1 Tax=Methanoculleus sp. 7T TaxID=2937282 RepID=UPI0020BE243C|nr:DUF1673 domain-containing protein [Methanoculleus sp. 7T]MCK8517642.1 DUF1673 domain-containing protein [Methanoculleus sp. 7T]